MHITGNKVGSILKFTASKKLKSATQALVDGDSNGVTDADKRLISMTIAGWLLYPLSPTRRHLSIQSLQLEWTLANLETASLVTQSPESRSALASLFATNTGLVEIFNSAPRPKSLRSLLGMPSQTKSGKAKTYRQPKLWNAFIYSIIHLLYEQPVTDVTRQKLKESDFDSLFQSPKGERVGHKVVEDDCSRYKKVIPLVFGLFYGIRITTGCELFSLKANKELTTELIYENLSAILQLSAWYSQHWDAHRPRNSKMVRISKSSPPLPPEWKETIRSDIVAHSSMFKSLGLLAPEKNLLDIPQSYLVG